MRNISVIRKLALLGMGLSLSLLILALACPEGMTAPTTTKPTPQYGGILKRSYEMDAEQLGNPVTRPFSNTCFKMALPAIETLLRYDEKGVPVPWLATSWKISDDLNSVTLTLQKGIKFHDGTPFIAEAVKWNLDRYRNSKNPELKAVASIDVLNDSTVRLNLPQWDSTLLGNLAHVAGMMISPTAYQKAGSTDAERDAWCEKHPVGTGPFKFVSWQRDSHIKYEKFDGYWQKGKPYLDGIEWVIITDLMVKLAAFKAGEVDEISNVEPKDVNDLKASGKYYGTICELSSLAFSTIGDSVHPNSPFADIRVRRAVEHAIDKKALADAFTYGLGKVCNQFAAPGSWGYNPDVNGYPYNPDKAKQLLAEAGYPNGFKTKIITLPMAFYAYPPTAVQGYLGKVGVVAEVETAPPPKWQQTNLSGWENALFVHNGTLVDPDATRNLATNFSSKSILSISMLRPAELNEAIVKAQVAGDFETKKKWTWEAQKLLIDKYALVNYFFTQPRITFLYNKVHDTGIGVTIDAHWTPENAWMEK